MGGLKPGAICTWCKKRNHTEEHCRAKDGGKPKVNLADVEEDDEYESDESGSEAHCVIVISEASQNDTEAFVATVESETSVSSETALHVKSKSKKPKSKNMVLDSGCTQSMVNGALKVTDPKPSNSVIQIADGHPFKHPIEGSLTLPTEDGCSRHPEDTRT